MDFGISLYGMEEDICVLFLFDMGNQIMRKIV